MDNGKIPVKMLDKIWNFVITVPVEDLRQCCFKDLPVLVNMEIESQSVEVSCGNDYFQLPVLESRVIIFIGDGDTLVKGHVGQVHIGPDPEFVEVNELDFHDLD